MLFSISNLLIFKREPRGWGDRYKWVNWLDAVEVSNP